MKLFNKSYALMLVAVLAITTLAATTYEATTWTVDKSHSAVTFKVRHFFTPVNGTFDDYTADIKFDPNNLEESSINVQIAIASVNTDNDRRDGHLRTPDFFDAETYPYMTFQSSEIMKTGDNQFVAKGELTIKDVTKEIELPFTLLGVMDVERQNKKVAGITAETQILRNDFGVGTGDYISDAVIGNEVNIQIQLELNSPLASN